MDFQFEITRRLSREHHDVGQLMARLQSLLAAAASQPDWRDPRARRVLADLKAALEGEIPRHFAIEESELFPLIAEEGDPEMVDLLQEDHRTILALAAEIRPLVVHALERGVLELDRWESLRSRGQAFATELASHADKEELGLVPALDELLDADEDRRIQSRYAAMA